MSKSYLNIIILIFLFIPLASASYAPSSSFPKETLFFDRLVANNEQIKLINNEEILFTSIGITTNQDITRARIIVQAMPDCPENAPYQKNVLQCFFVSSNFNEDNITNLEIIFKVPKEWIKANNFDKNTLQLKRYSYSWNENMHGKLSNWKSEKTSLENEDENYYYYKTISDGIDYFSIVGIEKQNKASSNKITTNAIIGNDDQSIEIIKSVHNTSSNYILIFLIGIGLMITVTSIPKSTLQKNQSTFQILSTYIKSSDMEEKMIKHELKKAGWQEWQIQLAFNETKR